MSKFTKDVLERTARSFVAAFLTTLVAYVQGSADNLVTSAHYNAMQSGFDSFGYFKSLTLFQTPANHDNAMLVYDWPAIQAWLANAVADADYPWRPRITLV